MTASTNYSMTLASVSTGSHMLYLNAHVSIDQQRINTDRERQPDDMRTALLMTQGLLTAVCEHDISLLP